MSSTGPHHAADRSKSRKSVHNKTSIILETPKSRKSVKPSGRLGPVQSATTPSRKTIGHGFSIEFLEARKGRQWRHNARLANQPKETLIVGGINPFITENVVENIKKMREAVAKKFLLSSVPGKPAPDTKPNTTKLVFREENEQKEGGEQNSTITIDD